jgi:GTPase SAR1 family protein
VNLLASAFARAWTPGVGKTALIERFVNNGFGSYFTGLCAAFHSKRIMINGQAVLVQCTLWRAISPWLARSLAISTIC